MRCVYIAAAVAASVVVVSVPGLARGGAPLVAAGSAFTCTPVAVWDGDGPIWCAEGPKVRLAGIAAREIDGSCRRGHPCPPRSGIEARDALVRLIGRPRGIAATGHVRVSGPPLQCRSDGFGKGDRTAAWCSAPQAGDLSCALVDRGFALRWGRYWRDARCRRGG